MSDSLKEVTLKVRACINCPLYHGLIEGCAPVPGKGSPSAKVMVVGLSPTHEALMLGEPFSQIDKATLDKLFFGFPKSYFYYTNLLKCPTKYPAKKYLNPCLTHFFAEYNSVKPQVIISLGLVASKIINELKLNCAHIDIPAPFSILHGKKEDMDSLSICIKEWIR